jgi:hypothetical protein
LPQALQGKPIGRDLGRTYQLSREGAMHGRLTALLSSERRLRAPFPFPSRAVDSLFVAATMVKRRRFDLA